MICSSIEWNSYKRSKKKFADERVFHAKKRQIRNKDDDKTVKLRMKEARSEISHWSEYDYILVNDNFEKVKKNIIKIIEIEKIKRNRQNTLPDFISKLNMSINS